MKINLKDITLRYFNARFLCYWSIVWAVGVMAISPVVNYVTPLLNSGYNSQWTPDILYRLNMYWHGGIFLPWVIVLLTVVYVVIGLDSMKGVLGRLVRIFLFGFGFFAVPLAGIGGIFNVTDKFAWGIPHLLEYPGFAVLDLASVAIMISLIVYPRLSGKGYRKMGLPFYVLLLCVIGSFIAAMLGYVAAYITVSGPSPPIVSHYINSTMYPVLGYYNSTAVITFAQNVVGSHSHAMLPILMAGIVVLVAIVCGYDVWSKGQKIISSIGFLTMFGSVIAVLGIYLASGIGNYQVPTLFASGPNGVAQDDIITGVVGLGALFVLVALLLASGKKGGNGHTIKDPLFASVVIAWIIIYLVIPVNGFYINFNEAFYSGAGSAFDDAYTRFHQDYAFFLLPILVTTFLIFEMFEISGIKRKRVGYLYISGEIIIFVLGEIYSMVTLNPYVLYGAGFGGALVAVGALMGARALNKTGFENNQLGSERSQ
ncbi:MAG: hypothetical protein KGI10_00130 [Thaumarchaeota archaeon]|nr:hypothetical protein [Nitrososphaerota archaeon]